MATYTTNLDLKKPGTTDKIRIADINGNMDDIDAAFGAVGDTPVATQLGDIREGLAIVSTGNTHSAIAAGQFVYVMNHSTLSDGLYTANSAISANATLSNSNLTAVSGGGLNVLNNLLSPLSGHIHYISSSAKASHVITAASGSQHFLIFSSSAPAAYGIVMIRLNSSGTVSYADISKGSVVTYSTGTNTLTISLDSSRSINIIDISVTGTSEITVS